MWGMSEHTGPPPEGALITAALKRRRLSARAAAPQAGISETRWRQITSGYQTVSGQRIPVRAPDDTIARMAQVAGVTPEELINVGRVEAAEELRNLPSLEEPEREPSLAELAERLERQERTTARLDRENNELRKMFKEITGKDSDSSGSLEEDPRSDKPRQAM
jgi:hypothetical protein